VACFAGSLTINIALLWSEERTFLKHRSDITPMTLKSSLKRLRSSQPFNRAATSSLKLLFDFTKWQP
jgi:hypothetical protein